MRLFVALQLPEDIQQKVATLRGGIPEARWIPEGNAHITLAFIGEVPNSEISDISVALGRIEHLEFQLQLEGVGVFGNSKRPRVLWAGVSVTEPLQRLQQKISSALENAGFQFEDRRFKPHVTLSRIHLSAYEHVRHYLSDNALFKTAPIFIENFTLFSSHLAHTGAIHTEEIVFDLASKADNQLVTAI